MDDRFLRLAIGAAIASGLMLAGCEQSVPPPLPSTRVMAVETPPPVYPLELACADIGGRVLLQLSIGPDGRPTRVETLESSGQPALDASAAKAVEDWTFQAATRAGQPVASQINVPMTFTPPVEKPDSCFALEDQQRKQQD
ncbi:MAG TPA: energy transducer TonB [Lysobacter sp.]|nr:energy transducer TonB [Lysobacter sp.]